MAEALDDLKMTEMRRKYPEYDDMSYNDFAAEDDKLEAEDNQLNETIDEAIELDIRRDYEKKLMEEKFPNEVGETLRARCSSRTKR